MEYQTVRAFEGRSLILHAEQSREGEQLRSHPEQAKTRWLPQLKAHGAGRTAEQSCRSPKIPQLACRGDPYLVLRSPEAIHAGLCPVPAASLLWGSGLGGTRHLKVSAAPTTTNDWGQGVLPSGSSWGLDGCLPAGPSYLRDPEEWRVLGGCGVGAAAQRGGWGQGKECFPSPLLPSELVPLQLRVLG